MQTPRAHSVFKTDKGATPPLCPSRSACGHIGKYRQLKVNIGFQQKREESDRRRASARRTAPSPTAHNRNCAPGNRAQLHLIALICTCLRQKKFVEKTATTALKCNRIQRTLWHLVSPIVTCQRIRPPRRNRAFCFSPQSLKLQPLSIWPFPEHAQLHRTVSP